MKYQEELEKVMRQINKVTSFVQSDRMLKDLPKQTKQKTTKDGIAHNEYSLIVANGADCISEK